MPGADQLFVLFLLLIDSKPSTLFSITQPPACLSKKVGLHLPARFHAHSAPLPGTNDFTEAWPSSAAFDLISDALSDDAERKDAVKKGGAIFAFTLKNDQGEQKDWHIDLKESGTVGKGTAPDGKKPGGEYTSSISLVGLPYGRIASLRALHRQPDTGPRTGFSWFVKLT